jgi:hypothetical protein
VAVATAGFPDSGFAGAGGWVVLLLLLLLLPLLSVLVLVLRSEALTNAEGAAAMMGVPCWAPSVPAAAGTVPPVTFTGAESVAKEPGDPIRL